MQSIKSTETAVGDARPELEKRRPVNVTVKAKTAIVKPAVVSSASVVNKRR